MYSCMSGRSGGDTLQMRFDGRSFVAAQPYEEVVAGSGGGS